MAADDEPAAMVTIKREDPSVHACLLNLSRVYNSPGSFCDVVLKVGGRVFYAHKVVLSVCSPVFAAMLSVDTWQEGSKAEIALDEDAGCFEAFLRYIYSQEIRCANVKSRTTLYTLADKYQVSALRNILALSLCSKSPVADLCDTVEWMQPFTNIRFLIKHQLATRFEEVVRHGCIGRLSLETLTELIGSDELAVGSEILVFQSVCQWIKGGESGEGEPPEKDSALSCNPSLGKYHRGSLASALFHKVRYHLMPPHDLELVQTNEFFPFSASAKDVLLSAYRRVCSPTGTLEGLRCKPVTLGGITKQGLRKAKFLESSKQTLFGKSWKLSCDTNGGDSDVCLKLSYEKTTVPYNIVCTLFMEAPGRVMYANFNRTTSTAGDESHSWGYTVFCSLSELTDSLTWTARAVFRITAPSPEWYTRPTSVAASSPPCTAPEPYLVVVSKTKGMNEGLPSSSSGCDCDAELLDFS